MHGALLGGCHNSDINEIMCIIGQLYHLFSLLHYYHTYNTLISPSRNNYKTLYKIAIMTHYNTIITLICIIAIMTILLPK